MDYSMLTHVPISRYHEVYIKNSEYKQCFEPEGLARLSLSMGVACSTDMMNLQSSSSGTLFSQAEKWTLREQKSEGCLKHQNDGLQRIKKKRKVLSVEHTMG